MHRDGAFPSHVRAMILLQVLIVFMLAASLTMGPLGGGPGQGQKVRVPASAGAAMGAWSACPSSSPTSTSTSSLAELAELREQLLQCSERKTEYRKQWGTCSCKYTHTGPRGGYCVSKNVTTDNEGISEPLADQLITLFMNSATVPGHPTVWDFGCGVGQYGRYFQVHAPDLNWQGFDGAEGIEPKTDGRVKFLDLTEPAYLPVRDWSMSLEVGEHIPAEFEEVFMDNLHRHNTKGILLSWGIPGQGGTNHINLHPNEYVIDAFTKRGYHYDQPTSQRIRQNSGGYFWFKNTIMVFRREQQ